MSLNMIQPINRDNLPLKYYLNIHNLVSIEPTELDILFDICSDELSIKGKEMTITYIKHLLSFKIDVEKLEVLLNNLIEQKYIINVQTKKEKLTYKLFKHPWL